MAAYFELPELVEAATAGGWATHAELAGMGAAWRAWAERPDAFLARFWCEALGWAP